MVGAGFIPVKLSLKTAASVYLMLLRDGEDEQLRNL